MVTMFQRIKTFFMEARHELRHVNWPSRQETVRLTVIVIGLSLVLAAFLGALDYFLSAVLRTTVARF